jgi:hypothetical protein
VKVCFQDRSQARTINRMHFHEYPRWCLSVAPSMDRLDEPIFATQRPHFQAGQSLAHQG